MRKRNIPFVMLILVAFVLIVIACSRSQAQRPAVEQPAAEVEQSAESEPAAEAQQGEAQHQEAEAEHDETEAGHQETEAQHEEAGAGHDETETGGEGEAGHGPAEHVAGGHGVPPEAAAVENPVPATEESVTTGAALYAQNCAVCHGETGEGDGPAAAGLEKEPANLHAGHVQANSDGALFWIISHGKPETPMPPWDNVLTEEERWHVVNFLRTFNDGQETGEHEETGATEEGHNEGSGHTDSEGDHQ